MEDFKVMQKITKLWFLIGLWIFVIFCNFLIYYYVYLGVIVDKAQPSIDSPSDVGYIIASTIFWTESIFLVVFFIITLVITRRDRTQANLIENISMKNKVVSLSRFLLIFSILVLILQGGAGAYLYRQKIIEPVQSVQSEVEIDHVLQQEERAIFIGFDFIPNWIFKPDNNIPQSTIIAPDIWSTSDMRNFKYIRSASFIWDSSILSSVKENYPEKFKILEEAFQITTIEPNIPTPPSIGIGIYLTKINDSWVVNEILKDSPSDKAGIQIDDKIIRVDGKDASSFVYYADILKAFRGNKGSEIKLSILTKNNEQKEITLKRDIVLSADSPFTPQFASYRKMPMIVFKNKIIALAEEGGAFKDYNDTGIWTSADGKKWKRETTSLPWTKEGTDAYALNNLVAFNDKLNIFVRVYEKEKYTTELWSSSDGINWEKSPTNLGEVASTEDGHIEGEYFLYTFNEKFWFKINRTNECCFEGVNFYSSSDGANWKKEEPKPEFKTDYLDDRLITLKGKLWLISDLAQGCGEDFDGEGCTYSEGDTVWSSDDGVNWAKHQTNLSTKGYLGDVILFKEKLYVIEHHHDPDKNIIWSSSDGTKWVNEGVTPLWDVLRIMILPKV